MAKKKPSEAKTYRIRNRLHEVETGLSEKDLLRRITKGKITGDEEFSLPPYEKWKKLSSEPTFYDALLKRLYQADYAPAGGDGAEAEQEEPSREADSARDKATRQGGDFPRADDQAEKDAGDEDSKRNQRTKQIGEEKAGATIHQSAIDELFSESARPKEVQLENTSGSRPGTGLVPVPIEIAPDDTPPSNPLNMRIPQSEEPPEITEKKRREKRRRLMFAGALVAVLVLLFQMGTPSKPSVEVAKKESDNVPASIHELINASSTKEEKIRRLVDEGDRLYENDTPLFYGGARDLFAEALAVNEGNAAVLGRFAESSARFLPYSPAPLEVETQAKEAIAKGRMTDPQASQFYRSEALIALFKKDFEGARKNIGLAADADPSNSENFLVRGEIAYAIGDIEQARTSFNEVVKANPYSVRAHWYLERIAMDQRDDKRATREALEALRINPIHADSYYDLAQIASEQNRLKEAKQLYKTCVALAKFGTRTTLAGAYYRLGLLQELSGEKDDAQKSFQLSFHFAPENKAILGDKIKGLDVSDKTTQELADSREYGWSYFSEQSESLVGEKKYKEALVFLRAASLLRPHDAMPLVRLGEVTEKLVSSYDDFQTVVSYYQRAIEKDPSASQAYVKLGLLESEQFNFDRAYKLLKQAEALAPEEADPYVALGKHYYRAKDYGAAIDQFSKAFKMNPYDSEILYYAGLLALLGRKEGQRDALNFFYRAYLLNPLNYDALVEWSKLKVARYEKNFALKFIKNLIEQDPKNANWYWVIGEIYAANKEFRRAVASYHQALDLDNRMSKVRMSLAKSLEAVGEFEAAIAEYRVASLVDRRNSEGFFRAADLLIQSRNVKDAEESLKYLVAVTPSYPGAHRALSQVYQAKNMPDQAIEEMKKEVTNNPLNVAFRLEYAELLMIFTKNEEAITELTEVANLPTLAKPEAAYEKVRAYLLLSRAYRTLNQFESAEGTIHLALDIDANDPELHRELGYVYYGEQRPNEAVKAFEYYLNRNPAATDANTIRSLIRNSVIDE